VVQLHYHNAQLTEQTDLTELRLRAAKGPVQKRLHFMRVGQFRLRIPAGDLRYEIEAGSVVGQAMQLIAIHPHMHMLGREMKVWARMKAESIKPRTSRRVTCTGASEPSTRWGTPPSSIRWTTRS